MPAEYNIKDLAEKYEKFASPSYSIEIDGKKLDENYTKTQLTVELTATFEASWCKFEISNAFKSLKGDKITLEEDINKSIKLGSKVEVIVGYKNVTHKRIFLGYIDTIYLDYNKGGDIVYTVECLDAKGIMMNSIRSEVKTSIKKYSEAVENILKGYSSLVKIDSKGLDKSDAEVTTLIEQHNESDYDFIVKIAKKLNYNFFILNGYAVFKPKAAVKKELLFEFNINEYVKSFTMKSALKNQVSSVTVRANNEKDPTKPFQATANKYKNLITGAMTKPAATSVINNKVSQTIIDLSVDSEATAKARAEAKLMELSYSLCKGKIGIVGLPELVPGRIVKVEGFGANYNQKYYVSKVIHHIKDSSFTTECELEVNKV